MLVLFSDMLFIGVCTTRQWQTTGRVVKKLPVCFVPFSCFSFFYPCVLSTCIILYLLYRPQYSYMRGSGNSLLCAIFLNLISYVCVLLLSNISFTVPLQQQLEYWMIGLIALGCITFLVLLTVTVCQSFLRITKNRRKHLLASSDTTSEASSRSDAAVSVFRIPRPNRVWRANESMTSDQSFAASIMDSTGSEIDSEALVRSNYDAIFAVEGGLPFVSIGKIHPIAKVLKYKHAGTEVINWGFSWCPRSYISFIIWLINGGGTNTCHNSNTKNLIDQSTCTITWMDLTCLIKPISKIISTEYSQKALFWLLKVCLTLLNGFELSHILKPMSQTCTMMVSLLVYISFKMYLFIYQSGHKKRDSPTSLRSKLHLRHVSALSVLRIQL